MYDHIDRVVSRLPVPNYLVTGAADLSYLTGINLEGFWLLLTKKGATVFAPPLLAGQLRRLLPDLPVVEGDRMIKIFAEYCRKNRIKTIGIDAGQMSYALASRLNKAVFIKETELFINQIRCIKDAVEIERIRRACRIGASAARYAQKIARPGMNEIEIAFKIDEYFAKNKVKPSFATIVASGPNSANPHHLPTSRKLERPDIVLIDIGCSYEGYCSDLTRTFFLGKMNSLQRTVYALVNKAQIAAVRSLRPGMRAGAVDRTARGIIAHGGYGKRFIHSTGHGIGVEVHESPRITRKDTTVLKPGMVVTVEPGVYLDGAFGVRIEDTVLVTEKGREVLTQ